MPAYASGGDYLEGKTPRNLGEELAGYVRQGFRAVKMKAGRLTPAQEEERVRAARDAIGPDVLLMLDVNNAWADLPTALLYCKRFEKYDIYWVEEPFSPDDIENHARLASCIGITVATGEIEAGRDGVSGKSWRSAQPESCRRMRPSAAESRMAPDRADGGQLRRDYMPALAARSARAPGGVRAQRALCRVFPRRPGLEFSR